MTEDKATNGHLDDASYAKVVAQAKAGDIKALRELQLHYDLSSMDAEREKVHQKLVVLGDSDSLDEYAMRLANDAAGADNASDKLKILGNALESARRAARSRGLRAPKEGLVVEYLLREQRKVVGTQSKR